MLAATYHRELVYAFAVALVGFALIGFLSPLWYRYRVTPLRRRADNADGDEKKRLDSTLARAKAQSKLPVLAPLVGYDGRLSTSKAAAAAWAFVVAVIMIALVWVWPGDWSIALKNLSRRICF
jgi:hypothetical protein